MNDKRIIGEKRNISYEAVQNFFEERGGTDKKHLYNYVMYLDDKPEVAVERDRQGKEKMDKLICVSPNMRVLDIGCGVGRYGTFFLERGAYYVGVDGSAKMIEKAEMNLNQYNGKKLIVSNLLQISETLDQAKENEPFDIVFDSGVFMYLNDDDCLDVMKKIACVGKKDSIFCLIESMAQEERLTLNEFYSDDLKQSYSAIYRSENEYRSIMEFAFGRDYEIIYDEILDFEDGLQKKRQHVTMEHCFIWKHK